MTVARRTSPGVVSRVRGAVLLEVTIALSMFTMAALAVIAAVAQGRASVERAELELRAADLARSVMGLIEAGVVSPEAVSGPAPEWDPEIDLESAGPLLAALAETSGSGGLDARGWMIEAEIEPTDFDGLSLVTVRASLVLGADPESPDAQATLRQFVRLDPPPADELPSIAHLFPERAESDEGEAGFAAREGRLDRGERFNRDRSAFEREDPFADRDDPFAERDDPFAEREDRMRGPARGGQPDEGPGAGGRGGGGGAGR